ncbi:hypothetical protein ACI799_01595 [Blastococcus sp. SYSU DS0753]
MVPDVPGTATIPPAQAEIHRDSAADHGFDDAAVVQRLLAASAQRGAPRTGRSMPNSAPPAAPVVRRRAAARSSPAVPRPSSRSDAGRTSASDAPGRQASPALTGVPSSWTGLGELLSGAGERPPEDALTLAAVTSGARENGGRAQVDLSGIWALPAGMAAARSTTVLRALDSKGRLQLPVDAGTATKLPAERDGALVTVYLPGSTAQPRPGFATVALPLDARGRLTVTTGVRADAGIPDGADVLAVVDPDRRTITLTAASRLTEGITALLDGLRRPAAAASDNTARPLDDAVGPAVTGADTGPATVSGGRLRIVG